MYTVLALLAAIPAAAQVPVDTGFARIPISYSSYLHLAGQQHLGYAAEKFNLDIADANIESARIFPDPELSLGYGNNGQYRMHMGYSFSAGMAWTLELGRKRKARMDLARSEATLQQSLLADYFRNLRADITLAYLDALKQKAVFEVQLNSYVTMKGIADADSIRSRLGSIAAIDARQSKLQADAMLNSVYQGEADWKTALLQLNMALGKQHTDTLYLPSGELSGFDRNFDPQQLALAALDNRADLLAALRNKEVAQQSEQLAKANRATDLGLNFGVGNTSVVSNVVAPTPSFTTVSAGLTLPLKYSNKYKGTLRAAAYSRQQAALLYRQTELQVQNEVMQAWYHYEAIKKQVQQFNTGMLTDARAVLDGKIYSYRRGATSLLEVLNAQQTYNETRLSYWETLYHFGAALVTLEKAAGIWDIDF